MRHIAGRFSIPLLALFCLSIVPVAAVTTGNECAAEVSVDLTSEEAKDGKILLRFDVELRASSDCSTLSYDLLIEELLPNKQTKIIRLPREVELENGARSETVEHSMTTDLKMLGYDANLVACECAQKKDNP